MEATVGQNQLKFSARGRNIKRSFPGNWGVVLAAMKNSWALNFVRECFAPDLSAILESVPLKMLQLLVVDWTPAADTTVVVDYHVRSSGVNQGWSASALHLEIISVRSATSKTNYVCLNYTWCHGSRTTWNHLRYYQNRAPIKGINFATKM